MARRQANLDYDNYEFHHHPPDMMAQRPLHIPVPVIHRSQVSRDSSDKVPAHRPRDYGPEPLPWKPSDVAPRNAKIIGRVADPVRVSYTLDIGGTEIGDVGVQEILDYVSAYELERFENAQFVEERELLELFEEERKEDARATIREREERKLRAEMSASVEEMLSEDEQDGISRPSESTGTGRHGRARPTYTHMFLQNKPRKRVDQDDRDSEQGSSSDDQVETRQAPITAASSQRSSAQPAVGLVELPRRRRRKRDKVTGELLPLEPQSHSSQSMADQFASLASVDQPARPTIDPETGKRPRRRRHPITKELMPLGWRYDRDSDHTSTKAASEAQDEADITSFRELSIAREPERKRPRLTATFRPEISQVDSSLATQRFPGGSVAHDPPKQETRGHGNRASKNQNPVSLKAESASFGGVLSSRESSVENISLASFNRPGNASNSRIKDGSRPTARTSITNPIVFESEPEAAQPASEDESGEEAYFIEAILGHHLSDPRTHGKGIGKKPVMLYKVKWEGYEEPTWEPIESFEDPSIVMAYRRRVGLDGNGSRDTDVVAQALNSNNTTQTSSAGSDRKGSKAKDARDVERILQHRLSEPRAGHLPELLYLVKWKNRLEPTWEVITEFDDTSIFDAYEARAASEATALGKSPAADQSSDDGSISV